MYTAVYSTFQCESWLFVNPSHTMNYNTQNIDLNEYSSSKFVEQFGGLYEHSPWVAELVWGDISGTDRVEFQALAERLKAAVDGASDEQKMTLLCAHPELAGKAAVLGELTAESTDEQSRARLDLCSEEEFAKFHKLNSAYNEKFGFPFIMAVRNSSRAEILDAFESRLNNSIDQEFETALQQVHQIALLRLQAAAPSLPMVKE